MPPPFASVFRQKDRHSRNSTSVMTANVIPTTAI
jgi:hypothetical protein